MTPRAALVEAMARAMKADADGHDDWPGPDASLHAAWLRSATAALAALEAHDGGCVVVPSAAAMTDAQCEAIVAMANCCGGIAYDIYRVAIAASPYAKETT